MKTIRLMAFSLGCWLMVLLGSAQGHGGVVIGVGIGVPIYRPYCGPYYYRPYVAYPVVVAPAPIVVASPPTVVVQPAPVVQPVPAVQSGEVMPRPNPVQSYQPGPQAYQQTSAPPPLAASVQQAGDASQLLQLLNDPSEQVRSDAVIKLGRMKVDRAVDPLAATLASDPSPVVREAAARALGLIGSSRALPALAHAGQADADRDVRRSAQFAVEIIQTNPR
jgi:hypothetical protein